ncbi:MAG: DAHL domain-containing protein [Cellvibrionaceae bacterium]
MRISIVLVFLLAILGIALGVFSYKNHQEFSNQSYLEGLSLINQLKHADAGLNILLLKSRYGLQADYDDMAKKTVFLNDGLSSLKSQYLQNYLENDLDFSNAFKEYEEQLSLKVDLVESFKSHNAVLRNSIKYAPPLGDKLILELESKNNDSVELLKNINRALYRWSLYSDKEQADIIQANSRNILDLTTAFENDVPLLEYNSHVIAVVDEQEQTQSYLNNALSVNTENTLANVDSFYTSSYLSKSADAGKFRTYAMIAYGVLAALVALYFAWLLRKSYTELEDKVDRRTQQINTAYSELKESQEQLVQSEKMASLGQMVAGVAHEINTPLGYVNNNVSIVSSLFTSMEILMKSLGKVYQEALNKPHNKEALRDHLVQSLKKYHRMEEDGIVLEAKELLEDSSHGLSDISELVKNLRSFSRLDRQTVEQFDIADGLNNTLKIASSIIKKSNLDVVKNYNDLVFLECNPSKINQVFLNIITNSAQAMPENGGQLTIDVEKIGDNVEIRFTDSGEGMDEEAKAKIFDPFFTTKPVGEGTGLGMAISYKIVREHKGQIEVTSAKGEGATITLTFPLEQPEE